MTAALLGTALGVVAPSQAANASPQAEAYVVSADALAGLVKVDPTPDSKFPPGGTQTVVGLNVGSIATDAALTATTAGDAKAGTASASATGDHLTLNVPLVGTLVVTGVKATCDAPAAPGTATGDGIIATAVFTPVAPAPPLPPLPAGDDHHHARRRTRRSTVQGLGAIVFNKQSHGQGRQPDRRGGGHHAGRRAGGRARVRDVRRRGAEPRTRRCGTRAEMR